MPDVQSLTAELNSVLTEAPVSRRITMLQQVTVLSLDGTAPYPDEQRALIDIAFTPRSRNIERPALIELSGRLAAANVVPAEIAKRLACDDDIAVAGPILKGCDVLVDDDVAE